MHDFMKDDIVATFNSLEMAEKVTIDGEEKSSHVFNKDNDFDGLLTHFHFMTSEVESIAPKTIIEHNGDNYEVLSSHKDESGFILIVTAQNKERY